jgi:peptide/nickel transport system substrate-binding protein
MLSSAFLSGGDWNESHWANERFDTLVSQAAGELDQNKRKEMYFEAQELLYNDSGVIIPVFASLVHAASTKLGHGDFRGNRYFDNDSIIRTGWLKG